MEQHDFEIEVRKGGEVKIHIKGAKGEECMSYVDFFEKLIGPIKDKQLTHEYYERDGKVRIDAAEEQRIREAEQ